MARKANKSAKQIDIEIEEQMPFDEVSVPVSGKLINVVVKSFCEAPFEGDDTRPYCSIGVGEDSIVATNRTSAIVIGNVGDQEIHVATQRKEVMLEASRSTIFGEPFRARILPRNIDKKTGEAFQVTEVPALVDKLLEPMTLVATFSPEALVAVGRAALAGGAHSVQLYQPGDSTNALGFKFDSHVCDDYINLFSDYGFTIPVVGIFSAKTKKGEEE